ncbi:DUF5320 domain-containing protein [Patescibacteria group bacterium]|nr:DUF5320 domain-containing protein [Patescibacteria group bacterium]MBU1682914.1 DUF5320 domain-containing protein [Patescibacteria group bacterium]MBU1935144.1 DUF5320 domain-containing protein [Patescibacteria group bacterium]
MPNFDKTGPEGKGPMTGRGMGPCNPNAPRGCNRGRGRNLGRRFNSESSNKEK